MDYGRVGHSRFEMKKREEKTHFDESKGGEESEPRRTRRIRKLPKDGNKMNYRLETVGDVLIESEKFTRRVTRKKHERKK